MEDPLLLLVVLAAVVKRLGEEEGVYKAEAEAEARGHWRGCGRGERVRLEMPRPRACVGGRWLVGAWPPER